MIILSQKSYKYFFQKFDCFFVSSCKIRENKMILKLILKTANEFLTFTQTFMKMAKNNFIFHRKSFETSPPFFLFCKSLSFFMFKRANNYASFFTPKIFPATFFLLHEKSPTFFDECCSFYFDDQLRNQMCLKEDGN